MRYATRLERLEQTLRSPEPPLRIIYEFVDPKDGIVECLDVQTDTHYYRGPTESEADFKARVSLAVESKTPARAALVQ